MTKLIGYARVSTRQQSTDRQQADILAAGVRRDDLYVDHGISGARASRPHPDRYSRDIGNVTREIIDRLAGAGANLEITIDIQASKSDGFDEGEMRTISENAHVLRFDPSSGFEN